MINIIKIQQELKVPKSQRNTFGNYNYRSCEDILEAVKPLLEKYAYLMTISDEVVNIGDRNYVKATVTITDGDKLITTSAFACESREKKGMDSAQITGAASSYARKYALNGMFAIDDTKDADTMDNTKVDKATTPAQTVQSAPVHVDFGSGEAKYKCEICGTNLKTMHKPDCKNNPNVKVMITNAGEESFGTEPI